MKRRIRRVAILSSGVALVLFLIPLGFLVMTLAFADARASLETSALQAALSVDPHFSSIDQPEIPGAPNGTDLGLYDATGTLVAGTGPAQADAAVDAALARQTAPDLVGGSVVVVVPTTSAETVTGAVRAAMPLSTVWQGIALTWLALLAAAALALLIGVVAARSLSRRVVIPMQELTRASAALGDGDFDVRIEPSGLDEIDIAGAALEITAKRLDDSMSRERELTSHASHQLRTPLTGLRALLENALTDPNADVRAALKSGIERADALEATIDEIIGLGRSKTVRTPLDVTGQLDEAERRWRGTFSASGRPIRVIIDTERHHAIVMESALRQILDVLLDNAARHGMGEVVLRVRDAHDAMAIDVEDAGRSIPPGKDLFQSGFSTDGGTGLGLALARQLAEDQGGQLLFAARVPRTRFTILLESTGA
ncbi:MAG: two-component sensor histidine kinase [Rhodoglobus sp.]|nr:two-component sensor histidine kinase [Rhodoglobus sp.]